MTTLQGRGEQDMLRQRREIQSATYFLVWHCGMRVGDAEDALEIDPSTIPALARAGSYWGQKCLQGLANLIDSMDSQRRKP